jgi:hypothetical protein
MIANTLKICPQKNILSASLKVLEYVIASYLLKEEQEVNEKMIRNIENCNNIYHSIGHIKH